MGVLSDNDMEKVKGGFASGSVFTNMKCIVLSCGAEFLPENYKAAQIGKCPKCRTQQESEEIAKA